MPQLIVSRREFAEIIATQATVNAMLPEQVQRRRVVARSWICRAGGRVVASEQLVSSSADGR